MIKVSKENRIRNILLAILPGLVVGGFLLAANTYYDLDTQTIMMEQAATINTPAGKAISFNSSDDSNFTVTGSGKNLTLSAAGGGAQKLTISSAGTGTDALTIDATSGGIDINSGAVDLSTQTVDVALNNAVDALNFDSNTLSIDASNNYVGIGTAAPDTKLTINSNTSVVPGSMPVGTLLHLIQADSTANRMMFDSFGQLNVFTQRRANGTAVAPTGLIEGDSMGNIGALGYGTTGYASSNRVNVGFYAAQNWTDSAFGTYLTIQTVDLNSTVLSEKVRVAPNGNLLVSGVTFGSETLTNGTFTGTGTPWTTTGDISYTSNRMEYTHSSGSGTLTQAQANLATAAKANRWYKFTYIVSSAVEGTTAYIGTEFADRNYVLNTANGSYTVNFRANSNPTDFKIYFTSTAGSIRFDTLTLTESISGDVVANGLLTGGGTNGIKIDGLGNVGIGDTIPSTLLSLGGTGAANGITLGDDAADSVNLYRSGANILKTDDALEVVGSITADHLHIIGGTDVLFSSFKGANSDGNNIFIGGGGQSSIGEVGLTGKGSNNSSFGVLALYNNTTGYQNSAFGKGSLYNNTTGQWNSAFGVSTLYNNTTGSMNSTFGVGSLIQNTTGSSNSAFGVSSLNSNTTGYYNSAFGINSLYDLNIIANDGSGNNTAIGYNTGRGIVTGINNTIIGANVTGLAAALSNNIILATGAGTVRLQFDANGQAAFPATGSTGGLLIGGDVNLYRSAADTLSLGAGDSFAATTFSGAIGVTGDTSYFKQATSTGAALQLRPTDDLNLTGQIFGITNTAVDAYLFSIQKDGLLKWGTDTNLYRSAANVLTTDDSLRIAGDSLIGDAGTYHNILLHSDTPVIDFGDRISAWDSYVGRVGAKQLALAASNGIVIRESASDPEAGILYFGSGKDTNIYRSAADTLSLGAGDSLVLPSGTGTYSQTFTGTTTDAMTIIANSLTSGNVLDISSTSTAAISGDALINVSASGANAASSITRYGIHSVVTATGSSSNNISGYFEASGGTGNVGVRGEASDGSSYGVQGISASGYGVTGSSTSGIAIRGDSVSGIAGNFLINPASTNTATEVLRIRRQTSGTAANNIGGSMDWYVEDSAGTDELSGRISNILTNATDGAEASALTFWTRTGGSSIAEIARINNAGLTISANSGITLSSGTGTYSQTFTGTTTDAMTIIANSLTSGNALDISSNSTAALNGDALVNISVSGANAASGVTRYGIYSSNTATGTTSINYGGYFSASGGATNYGVIGNSSDGSGVQGISTSGTGVYGQSTSNAGIYGYSTSSIGGIFVINPATTNTVTEVLKIMKRTSGTAAAGIGGAMDWWIEDDGGTDELTGRISNLLTNAGAATEASALTFWTRTGGAAIAERVRIDGSGRVGIGTTSPDTLLQIANNNWISAKDYAGTSYVNMFKVNESNEIEVGGTLNAGTLAAVADSGAITLFNMPVTSTPVAGTEMSASLSIDSNVILKAYAESDGLGGIQNKRTYIYDQLYLPTVGSTGGLVIGGDVNLYRSATDILKTDDSLTVASKMSIGSAISNARLDIAETGTDINAIYLYHTGALSGSNSIGADFIFAGANTDVNQGAMRVYQSSASTLKPSLYVSTAGNATALKVGKSASGAGTALVVENAGTGAGLSIDNGGLLLGGDANLYRSATNLGIVGTGSRLESTSQFVLNDTSLFVIRAADNPAIRLALTADSVPRLQMNTGGGIYWSSGSATADVNLYRVSADNLKTDDAFTVGGQIIGLLAGDKAAIHLTSTTVNTGITIGSDTNLYRAAANQWKTDDSFEVAGTLKIDAAMDLNGQLLTNANQIYYGWTTIDLGRATANTLTFMTPNATGTGYVTRLAMSGGAAQGSAGITSYENLTIQGTSAQELLSTYASSDTGSILNLNKYRGTSSSPLIVANNDNLGEIRFKAYDGAALWTSATILSQVDGTPGADDVPSRLMFYTTPDGTRVQQERMRINNAGYVGIGDTTPGGLLTLAANGNLVWGNINDSIIDDMESSEQAEWVESDGTNTNVTTEATTVKLGAGAMKVTTVAGSSNTDTLTKTITSTDYSASDRIGFWIRATQTGQIISLELNDNDAATDPHRNITIIKANEWQYEEWDLTSIAAASRNAVTGVIFIVDLDTSSPTIYVDQLRYYSSTARSAEMFVDGSGRVNLTAQNGYEIYTNATSNLPSMKINSAIVELNQPLNVAVGGDVGIAYDLVFTNTGLASITSEGALAISAGDSNHAENLTLGTAGTGDVIIDIVDSNSTYGGFKAMGSDSGSYVFRISPSGDVEIGGTGSGGSDLTIKQNATLTGGNLTISQLVIPGTLTSSTATTGGSCAQNTTYYYKLTAINDNGETPGSAEKSQLTGNTTATNTITVSWDSIAGATGYRLYRSTDQTWDGVNDVLVNNASISSPNTSLIDDCASDSAVGQTPPATNTTGGYLYASYISSNTPTIEFDRPINIDIGGDVEMAYDLYFSNTGLASITSEGALAISAGDSNHAENLTLGTAGTGDVIIDIVDSNSTYGGFKAMGSDSGSYVFRISPSGDVEIGGTGSGGSDLTIKQNATLTGGNLTISALDVYQAGSLVVTETTSGGSCTTPNVYYYVIVASNDNGDTIYSGQTSDTAADTDSSYTVSWNPVSGATHYKVYRSIDADWTDADDNYLVNNASVYAPTTSLVDDCASDGSAVIPSSTNTTGGYLYASYISSNTPTIEFDRPISIDIGGDVDMAYDLYFSNTGLASINSEGPLKISAGDPNHAENLTLATAGTGDIIIDIIDSDLTYGGVKVLGSDSGGYVFKISPTGDVSIGGTGSGGSDLTVKQNISLTGGNLTISKLATPGTLTSSTAATGGLCAQNTTYYFKLTAINDNGQTIGSAEKSQLTGNTTATNTITISWDAVAGATGYKLYRSTETGDWDADANDSLVDSGSISAPNTSLVDNCTGDTVSQAPPLVNTTGGDITGILSFSNASELTIASGIITATQTYHRVDGQGDANDDLDTINGGTEGDILILRAEHTDRTITVKDGTGNIQAAGDMALDNTQDTIALVYDGSNWLELARSNSGADIAESYYVDDLSIGAGDLVKITALDESLLSEKEKQVENKYPAVAKTMAIYDTGLFGVISTAPNMTLGGGYAKLSSGAETRSVVLVGRTPVKVSMENGPIAIGDFLTSSSVSGVAMKATQAGLVIGRALEAFDGNMTECNISFVKKTEQELQELKAGEEDTIKLTECHQVPSEVGKVMTIINVGWQGNDLQVVQNTNGEIIENGIQNQLADYGLVINEYGSLTLSKLKAQIIETENGMTIKDRTTGEQYCVFMQNGTLQSVLGACISSVIPASTPTTPAEETPAEETPAEETPAEETPAEQPDSEVPVEETPTEETPAEEVPAEQPASEQESESTPESEPTPEIPPTE